MPDWAADARNQRLVIHRLGADLYSDLVRLASASGELGEARTGELLTLASSWRAPAFPLDGRDLLALGVPAGPELGRMLDLLRREWEDADFQPDRTACLARAAQLAAAGGHLTP